MKKQLKSNTSRYNKPLNFFFQQDSQSWKTWIYIVREN